MTGAAQARGLRRARKLRALRIVNSHSATAAGPRSAEELRELWLAWGGLDPIVRIPELRRPSPESARG
jgi:hypothetical protein